MMAKKVDAKAAALAAAQGSGAVFEALADVVEAVAEKVTPAQPQIADQAQDAQPQTQDARPLFETPLEDAAASAASTIEDSIAMNAQAFNTNAFTPTIEAATERMRTMFDAPGMVERTQRLAQEAAALAKDNLEAMAASARIAAQNAGMLSQDVAEAGRKSFEGASEAMKGFAEAKSPTELLRLQTEFAKSYLETVIAEGARMTETLVKLTGEAMQPVQAQVAANVAKVKSITE